MPKIVDHEARRAELAAAAWRVIARVGIADTTMRDIAAEAGCSTGVLNHYFTGKDDLLLHALRWSHEGIWARYANETAGRPPAAALQEILFDNLPMDEQRRLETLLELSFWERALHNASLHGVQANESQRLRALLRRLLGLVVPADRAISSELDAIVDVLHAMIDGISLHSLLYPDEYPPARQAAAMMVVLSSLGLDGRFESEGTDRLPTSGRSRQVHDVVAGEHQSANRDREPARSGHERDG